MSDFCKEPINKSNFRQTLENHRLSKGYQQLVKQFNRAATAISLEFPSSLVSLNSRFYIPRPPIEQMAYAEMAEPGSVICLDWTDGKDAENLMLMVGRHPYLVRLAFYQPCG